MGTAVIGGMLAALAYLKQTEVVISAVEDDSPSNGKLAASCRIFRARG